MKILVLSDSHGEQRYMEQAVSQEQPHCIIHLGDRQRDAERLRELYPYTDFISVPGNCDLGALDEPVVVAELGGVRFFITHGHLHGVKMGLLRLYYAAREAGAAVAVYGHTHIANHEIMDSVQLLNPGAAGGTRPSYGIIQAEQGKILSCRTVFLSQEE